jgi:hypothetical protein
MWGIRTIQYVNDAYVEEERNRPQEPPAVLAYREQQLPASAPLETLIYRLRKPSPPTLDRLIQIFRPSSDEADFFYLLRQYLPEEETKITLLESPYNRMVAFARAFSAKYFPLYEDGYAYEEGNYEAFVGMMPVEYQAFHLFQYDEIPNTARPAIVVLAYVLENPYMESDRPAFAEAAAKLLPKALVECIPEKGFEISEIEDAVKGTRFEKVDFWAEMITHQTGNDFLDCGDIEEDGVEYQTEWDRGTVEELTRQWQAFERLMEEWSQFLTWYEKDLRKNTAELVELLYEKTEHKRPETLMDILGGENGNNNEKAAGKEDFTFPINDPRQGRLFTGEADGTPVGGAADDQAAAG